jgi:hypothetical protein
MDGIINIFDVATGKLVHTLEGEFTSKDNLIKFFRFIMFFLLTETVFFFCRQVTPWQSER